VTHGISGTACCSVSDRSTSAGATLTAVTSLCVGNQSAKALAHK
jgi:hypothetical protein